MRGRKWRRERANLVVIFVDDLHFSISHGFVQTEHLEPAFHGRKANREASAKAKVIVETRNSAKNDPSLAELESGQRSRESMYNLTTRETTCSRKERKRDRGENKKERHERDWHPSRTLDNQFNRYVPHYISIVIELELVHSFLQFVL